MGKTLLTSDLHFNHDKIINMRSIFTTQSEHDNYILDMISKLNKNDTLKVHGDFIFGGKNYDWYIEQLSKMSCKIKLIFGNHDALALYKESRLPKLELELPLYSWKNMWCSHSPIHPTDFRERIGNIHGHLHGRVIEDERYFNVCLDINSYKFVDLDEIKERFKII